MEVYIWIEKKTVCFCKFLIICDMTYKKFPQRYLIFDIEMPLSAEGIFHIFFFQISVIMSKKCIKCVLRMQTMINVALSSMS